jgi:stage V sporulation protein G
MEITEVRIKLMEDSDDRLQAFCSITFDNCFVVRDLKIIDGTSGPFVAMPSRKLTSHCHQCGSKNHLKAQYCNHCGARLREDRTPRDAEGRAKLYADIAHPINSSCREMIQNRVIAEFRTELDRSKQPGYMSRYDDEYDDDIDPATLLPPEEQRPLPPMPPGTQVQPAQLQPPPPHILPAPPPAVPPAGGSATGAGSTGGPHFGAAPSRDAAGKEAAGKEVTGKETMRDEADSAKATRENEGGKQKPKGDFGAGIF